MADPDYRFECTSCGRTEVPETPGVDAACIVCLEKACDACSLPFGAALLGRRRKLCRPCAEALGLVTTYGLDETWAETLRDCRDDEDPTVDCTVCGERRKLADAAAVWKICSACGNPVCPACLDPFASPPLCSECKTGEGAPEEEGGEEAGEGDDPPGAGDTGDTAGEGGDRSPLDLGGLLDALDGDEAPRPPRKPLLEDLSDDPGCAHETADPERQTRTVRTFYEAVTGERPPDPPAPPPEPRPSAFSRISIR